MPKLTHVRCPVRFLCSHMGCRRLMPGTIDVGVNETEDSILGLAKLAPGWTFVQDDEQPGRYVLFCEHHSWQATRTGVTSS